MRTRRAALPVLIALLLAPLALAQDVEPEGTDPQQNDADSLGDEDRLVDQESTIEDGPGIIYYVLIGAMSLLVFVGLLWLSVRYKRERGSRPPQ